MGLTTLKDWRKQLKDKRRGTHGRKARHSHVADDIVVGGRQMALFTYNEPEFATFPLKRTLPILAGRGRYIQSERSFYRVLDANGQDNKGGPAKPPQGTKESSTPEELRSKSSLELQHHLSPFNSKPKLTLPLSHDRRVGPQRDGFGWGNE